MEKEKNPYSRQPGKAFWASAVAGRHPFELTEMYTKKFEIGDAPIATAGSCFAQHVGRYIKERNFNFLDEELAPPHLPLQLHSSYGYGLYSARYGNVYTVRQLLQLFQRAFGEYTPVENYWSAKNGYVDPFRPSIEPTPFVSVEEALELQTFHLNRVQKVFEDCRVFIFTLGLTEAWINREDGAVYPVVPGSRAGGIFDASRYVFHNFTYPEIMTDLERFHRCLHTINPECKIILTVSPVSLAATGTANHIVSAAMYSKSVLRAVAGDFATVHQDVDYFPSYDIITSPASLSYHFMPDRRTIAAVGIDMVMEFFFREHFSNEFCAAETEIVSPLPSLHVIFPQADEEEICDEKFFAELMNETIK
ncbi:MAG: GSCFA domain-containing protein [Holosporales bacterium]|jgi:hypothetical protein|nr:GSCFA domain-containing protein [Holosporales bacterium]